MAALAFRRMAFILIVIMRDWWNRQKYWAKVCRILLCLSVWRQTVVEIRLQARAYKSDPICMVLKSDESSVHARLRIASVISLHSFMYLVFALTHRWLHQRTEQREISSGGVTWLRVTKLFNLKTQHVHLREVKLIFILWTSRSFHSSKHSNENLKERETSYWVCAAF